MRTKMSNTNLNCFLVFWILFTCLNLYISLLEKIKTEQCSLSTDPENNTFYNCADGTKVSMIKWTRGSDRKGVVTREYNPAGKLILIYGHPDDVH
jgi:hypothetical protein